MAPVSISLIELSICMLVIYSLRRLIRTRSALPLPPGPPGLPIIGNLLEWPSSNEWETLSQWAHQYGDIVYANVGGTHMVMLNSVEVATALLQGKGSIYSDRPSLFMAGELIGLKKITSFMDEGPKHRESRRFFTQEIGTKMSSARSVPMMETRIRQFVTRLIDDPESHDKLFSHISTFTSGVILDATYGYDVQDSQDQLMTLGRRTIEDATLAARPGAYLVDIFPWVDRLPTWFPGTGYRRTAAEIRNRYSDFRNIPFQYARDHLFDKESVQRSFVAKYLQDRELSLEQEEDLKHTAAQSYGAGSDTTIAAINYFFFFMTKYPHVQAKAQEEIDRVVGRSRLPSISDRPDLPYVNALVSEVLRYGPITPMGLAHRLRIDDMHNGYLLPKNSIVIPNIWLMARDSRCYKDPEVFDPTRFLGAKPEIDPRAWVFGFGRRICSGRAFADQLLFLTVATALATLQISKAIDTRGAKADPLMSFRNDGLVLHLNPYALRIRARSHHVESLLQVESVTQ